MVNVLIVDKLSRNLLPGWICNQLIISRSEAQWPDQESCSPQHADFAGSDLADRGKTLDLFKDFLDAIRS